MSLTVDSVTMTEVFQNNVYSFIQTVAINNKYVHAHYEKQ